jgi:hypothetical protein
MQRPVEPLLESVDEEGGVDRRRRCETDKRADRVRKEVVYLEKDPSWKNWNMYP